MSQDLIEDTLGSHITFSIYKLLQLLLSLFNANNKHIWIWINTLFFYIKTILQKHELEI